MNTKQLIVTSLLAMAAAAALASEATEFPFPPSTLTRAEVRADLARARASGELLSSAEAEQRPFAMAGSTRSRDEVRNEAWAIARRNTVDSLYVGG